MSEDRNAESRSRLAILDRADSPAGGSAEVGDGSAEMERGPRLRVRTIERTALVRFDAAAMLVTESDVRAVGEQLDRLVEEGHTRLLLNLSGVRYLSSDVLAVLVRRQERLAASGGSLQLCGLDPLLRDMLRITHLDRLLNVCSDEAEALGLLLP
jgi:anti-sigma B factor antagonist